MRAFATSTTRQNETEPFHKHTYRFPRRHWFVLLLTFWLAGRDREAYPSRSPRDGTVTTLQIKNGQLVSMAFSEQRYIKHITRI